MQPPEYKRFSTLGTATIFGVSDTTIRRWVRDGLIEPTKLGRVLIFTEQAIVDCRSRLKAAKARAVSPKKRPAKNRVRAANIDTLMHGITDHDY